MMLAGGISELGLTGSVLELSDEESDPLQIGSCWWEWGSGREIDAAEEMLFGLWRGGKIHGACNRSLKLSAALLERFERSK